MKKLFFKLLAKLLGKNLTSTPVDVIVDQLNERRRLPLGRKEFDEFADRIISSVPPLEGATPESIRFGLATMILHLGPQESHKEDAYFTHSLLKSASNQVCAAIMQELKAADDEKKKALAAEAAKANPAADATLERAKGMKLHAVTSAVTPSKDDVNGQPI